MKATLYALKCQKCGGLLKKIGSDKRHHTYTCVDNACKISYARVYIDNRFVEIDHTHTSLKRPQIPPCCLDCKEQLAKVTYAPDDIRVIECSCGAKMIYNDATREWELIEGMGA